MRTLDQTEPEIKTDADVVAVEFAKSMVRAATRFAAKDAAQRAKIAARALDPNALRFARRAAFLMTRRVRPRTPRAPRRAARRSVRRVSARTGSRDGPPPGDEPADRPGAS
jgi:hypothetical protein